MSTPRPMRPPLSMAEAPSASTFWAASCLPLKLSLFTSTVFRPETSATGANILGEASVASGFVGAGATRSSPKRPAPFAPGTADLETA